MIRQVLSEYPYGMWNAVAMILFGAVFIGVLWKAYRPANRKLHDLARMLPFTDEPQLVGQKGNPRHE